MTPEKRKELDNFYKTFGDYNQFSPKKRDWVNWIEAYANERVEEAKQGCIHEVKLELEAVIKHGKMIDQKGRELSLLDAINRLTKYCNP